MPPELPFEPSDPLAELRMPGYPREPRPDALDQVHPVTGKRYTSDGARIGDGLPDTGVLIGRMSQKARDAILAHPAIRTSRSRP